MAGDAGFPLELATVPLVAGSDEADGRAAPTDDAPLVEAPTLPDLEPITAELDVDNLTEPEADPIPETTLPESLTQEFATPPVAVPVAAAPPVPDAPTPSPASTQGSPLSAPEVREPLSCPTCGRIDLVRKVSAIYSGETTYGNFSGTSFGLGGIIGGDGGTIVSSTRTNLSGMSQTHLSSRLAPPKEPFAPTPWGGCSNALGFILLAAAGLFGLMWITSNGSDGSSSDPRTYGLITAVAFGLFYVLFWLKQSEAKRRIQAAQAARPEWQKAMARWNREYYCGRCHVVFEVRDE